MTLNDTLPKKDVFVPKEVAKYLGIHKTTVYLWIKTGKMKAVKRGDKLMKVYRDEVLRHEVDVEC